MVTRNLDIESLIETGLRAQDERAQKIIVSRFQLGAAPKKTLAELGNEYGLTRERIRQIEAVALKDIRLRIAKHEEAIKFLKLVQAYLNDAGHLRRGDLLARDFAVLLKRKEDETEFYPKLHFLARVMESPKINDANEEWHTFWYNQDEAYARAKTLVSSLLRVKDHDFDKFLKSVSLKFGLPDVLIINHLNVSKQFDVGPYGDLGATHWPHINPKTVRDKAYLVLWKEARPLHFREVANLVNGLGEKERAPATVHNELIKDPRFILVARGTYSLNR